MIGLPANGPEGDSSEPRRTIRFRPLFFASSKAPSADVTRRIASLMGGRTGRAPTGYQALPRRPIERLEQLPVRHYHYEDH